MSSQMDVQEKLKRTREHWESPEVESLKDSNLRALEIQSIVAALRKHVQHPSTATLADLGCGDGYDTERFAECVAHAVGFDYSREMLSRASQRQTDRLRFEHLDLLSDEVPGSYDTVVTKRFVINLGDWPIQSRSLDKIARVVKPGGLLVMLECYKQGLETLNRHRTALELPPLNEPFHNRYLDIDETMAHLAGRFSLVESVDFSTYYYFTRCLSPRLAADRAFEMDDQLRRVAEADDILQGARVGPQLLACFRKK